MGTYNDKNYLHNEYVTKGRSTSSIAKEWSSKTKTIYPNTIRRLLKKYRIPLRNKSKAQKNFLSRHPHPMEGKERTKKERRKISQGIQKWWDDLDPKDATLLKKQMSERAEQKWDGMNEKEKKSAIRKMHLASREKANRGSKNENMVAALLAESGYKIMQRTNQYTPRNLFEIDIAIPGKHIAIEWDGVAHFEPIYGDKNLKRTVDKDKRKNKVLIKNGWTVIRCRDHSTSHSVAFCQRAVDNIIKLINSKLKRKVYYIDAK